MVMKKSEYRRADLPTPIGPSKSNSSKNRPRSLKMVKNKAGKMVPDFAADGKGKMAKGSTVTKKKEGGVMKKKGMAKGGAVTKKKEGGKLTKAQEAARRKKQLIARQNSMVEAREGKAGSTPSEKNNAAKERMSKMFGMKLKAGGKVAKKKAGGVMKKKGMAKGGVVKKMGGGSMKKKGMAKGGAVTKKMGGGSMKKKGYSKGGVVKKMGGGSMRKKGMAKGGVARGSGAARPQRFTRNG